MEEETKFLAVRELAQQLDIIIRQQQKLGVSVQNIPGEEKQDAMIQQDRLIQGFVGLNRKIDPALALSLAVQASLWDNLDDVSTLWSLSPWCSSDVLDYSFEQYASRRTGRDPVTLSNWIRTAQVWLLEKIGPPGEIALVDPKTGLTMLERQGNETVPMIVEWDPLSIDFSKLLLCNRIARENELGDIGYGLLANPATRWVDLRDFIHNLMPWKRTSVEEPHQLSFFLKNGLLYVKKGALSEIVGSLEISSDNLLAREGVAKLIRTLNISIIV